MRNNRPVYVFVDTTSAWSNGAGSKFIHGGGARLMVSAVGGGGGTCIFFIQDKILLGGCPHPDYWGGACPPPLPAPMAWSNVKI